MAVWGRHDSFIWNTFDTFSTFSPDPDFPCLSVRSSHLQYISDIKANVCIVNDLAWEEMGLGPVDQCLCHSL